MTVDRQAESGGRSMSSLDKRIAAFLASKTFKQLWRFLAVGATATAIQYAVLASLVELARAPETPASIIAYMIGSVTTYTLNRLYTFDIKVPFFKGLAKSLPLYGIGLLLNTAIFKGLLLFGVFYMFAQVVATGIVTIYNYTVSRFVVFRA